MTRRSYRVSYLGYDTVKTESVADVMERKREYVTIPLSQKSRQNFQEGDGVKVKSNTSYGTGETVKFSITRSRTFPEIGK